MKSAADEYQILMDRFLQGEISAKAFQLAFLDKFKHETRSLDSSLFELLDGLFADVDAFCANPVTLAKLQAETPGFYLDEQSLKDRVSEVSKRLSQLPHE
jgi:hypothetical protein